jgi:triosephosphate isomerase
MIQKKLKAALEVNLKPILCLGSEERDQKKEFKKIKIQLKRALSKIKTLKPKDLIITYEPVWAISTTKGSKVATPKEVREGANFIRKVLIKLFDKNFAQRIKIIYGGSVDSKNIQGFIKEAQMAGVLIGGASLKAKEFIKAVKMLAKMKNEIYKKTFLNTRIS